MKKIKFTVVFYLIFLGISCICPSQGTTTFITIETASALLYSFDENGIFPYLDEFNREELGITVGMDSVSQNIISQVNFGFIESAYACSNPNETIYENAIDSLQIFTLFDYNDNFKVGDNFEPNLLYVSGFDGETFEINNLEDDENLSFLFKFNEQPTQDTLQFKITGRVIGKKSFELITEKVVLTK